MTAPIKDKIIADMKTAMRAHAKERLGTIRQILAALKQKEVDERIELTDEQILAILNKLIKQRKEAIVQFESGKRPDLVAKEQEEIAIIQCYLPAQLSDNEITQAIDAIFKETNASSEKDLGKIMGLAKARLQGKADLGLVNKIVKDKLATRLSD